MTDHRADHRTLEGHGGDLALAVLRDHGVETMFTLSGGHVFPLYDAAHTTGMRIVGTRHEQTAVFAADGVAKLTGKPGLAVLTAGPGVTNGISGVTTALFNASPVVVLGGRAPQWRWGATLQEFDHVPVLAPITKHAATVTSPEAIPGDVRTALAAALTPHRGPVFLDLPMEVVFSRAEVALPEVFTAAPLEPDADEVRRAADLIAGAERPVIIAGSDVYGGGAADALVAAAEALRVPVFANGQGRGCIPADHELAFSRSRKTAVSGADLVVVIGTPLDFRLGFGNFGDAKVVHIVDAPTQRATHVTPAVAPAGDLRLILTALADHTGPRVDHEPWLAGLRDAENAARAADADALAADTDPIRPSRIYGELRQALEKDAVVIGDGGDFVSYAGKYLDSYTPGCWLDPGPYGCLGTGTGYAIAARLVRPSSQVCLLYGDGAAGFSMMDVETLVRENLPVVMVMGNNGIWGLEKHPMKALYGYDVAADLQPELRYDDVVAALGGGGDRRQRQGDRARVGARVRRRRPVPCERAHRPGRRVPALVQPGLSWDGLVASREGASPMRAFSPVRLGGLECDAWVAYYRKRWLGVLWASIGMVRAGFGMSWPRTLRGAWYVLRANQAWAPYPDNDADAARDYMRRFYALVTQAHGETFDVDEASRREVEWWREHRYLQRDLPAGDPGDPAALVTALTALYEHVYGVIPEAVRKAARLRAEAMLISDEWVADGCDPASPLVAAERATLVRSYAALLLAVHR